MSEKIVDVEVKEVNKTKETVETKTGLFDGLMMRLRMVDWKKVAKVAGGVAAGALIAGVSYNLGAKSAERDDEEPVYGIPDYLDDEDCSETDDDTDENSDESNETEE